MTTIVLKFLYPVQVEVDLDEGDVIGVHVLDDEPLLFGPVPYWPHAMKGDQWLMEAWCVERGFGAATAGETLQALKCADGEWPGWEFGYR